MENFNALLTLSELKTLYSGKPIGICPLYKGVLSATKTFEATGNPITIPEYKSLVKLTTKFSPKQAGTGDPSPDNVRPISGYDSLSVTRCGKNLVDFSMAEARNSSETVEIIEDGVKWSGAYYFTIPVSGLPRGATIVASYTGDMAGTWRVQYSDNSYSGTSSVVEGTPITLDSAKEIKRIMIYKLNAGTFASDMVVTDIQLEFGSTPTDYEPYQGDTYDIALPETIYGGTVNCMTGEGSKTWGYIASYNGEALPGEWISDRDVYAPGATPTTGAQVAYKLATPEPFEVSQVSIPSLKSKNTFFTNAENMHIIYNKTSFWG